MTVEGQKNYQTNTRGGGGLGVMQIDMEKNNWNYFEEGTDCDSGIGYGLVDTAVRLEKCGKLCTDKGMGFMSHGRISSGSSTTKDKPAQNIDDVGRCYCSETCGVGIDGDNENKTCKKHTAYHVFGKNTKKVGRTGILEDLSLDCE